MLPSQNLLNKPKKKKEKKEIENKTQRNAKGIFEIIACEPSKHNIPNHNDNVDNVDKDDTE